MSAAPARATIHQYLTLERAGLERHEYVDGEIIAMAGETLAHGIISLNIGGLLFVQLKGTPCFAVSKDTKVRSGLGVVSARTASGMFSYPDILVVCGEPEYLDEHHDVINNPVVIVEVLSKSTESFDRGEKFRRYKNWNPTLKDYVLVSQDRALVEHFGRQPDDSWFHQEHAGLDATVILSSISCTLKLADIYDRIIFPEEPAEKI
jgi:Uma2 family endonuclease